ncbi:MAG: LpxI family protein [Planctomycetes bacterium]|nr:LpxI family protein [Planctomycetota bacterium]
MTAEPRPTDPDDDGRPIGLIAGSGRLPFMVADGVRRAGRRLAVVGFRGSVDEGLDKLADRFSLAAISRWSTIIRLLRRWSVRRTIMVGRVAKDTMYTPGKVVQLLPDWRTLKLWYGKLGKDHRDQQVLNTIADELAGEGIELISSVAYCTEHLAHEGTMTAVQPRPSAMEDVLFGWQIARRSADLDIGQALAVKDGDIIAVEAMEGTDRMIQRAGRLCRSGGWTLIKVARPNQDMRFDVPTIGPDTFRRLKDCGGTCVVVEAGRTIIIDKPQTLALADELRIPVVGKKP